MKTRVYLASPMTLGDKVDNLSAALKAMRDLMALGFAPFCPALSFFADPFIGADHATWLSVDLPWVAKADAVLRLPGASLGADTEEACARAHGVPVFHHVKSLIAHFAGTSSPSE